MYKGLAQLVGMEILETGRTSRTRSPRSKQHYADYDFFFVHVKKTDSYGEDGDFAGKVGQSRNSTAGCPKFSSSPPTSWSSPATTRPRPS